MRADQIEIDDRAKVIRARIGGQAEQAGFGPVPAKVRANRRPDRSGAQQQQAKEQPGQEDIHQRQRGARAAEHVQQRKRYRRHCHRRRRVDPRGQAALQPAAKADLLHRRFEQDQRPAQQQAAECGRRGTVGRGGQHMIAQPRLQQTEHQTAHAQHQAQHAGWHSAEALRTDSDRHQPHHCQRYAQQAAEHDQAGGHVDAPHAPPRAKPAHGHPAFQQRDRPHDPASAGQQPACNQQPEPPVHWWLKRRCSNCSGRDGRGF